jgi:predicted transcriptional regulator of viral defense system
MSGVGRTTTACLTQSAQPPLDRAIGDLATSQHGVIALTQLIALGLSASAVRMRVATGRLRRIHRGVYAVGHGALSPRGHVMAAVLACGPGAVASHRDAAMLHGLRPNTRRTVDVSSPGRRGRGIAGVDAHRGDTLRPADVMTVDGIPCTRVARTLLDLAEVVSRRQLERACDQAELLQLFDLRAVEDVLSRADGRRGAATLRAVLAEHAIGTTLTRNDLEERFLAICREAGIPQPEVNAWLPLDATGVEADFLWRSARLIAEVDGRNVHTTRRAFVSDRRRDQSLMLAGWRVVRFPRRQVVEEAALVAATVRSLLEQAA